MTFVTTQTGWASLEWTHSYDQRIPAGVRLTVVPDDESKPPLDLYARQVQRSAVPVVCEATSTDLPDDYPTSDED